MVYTAHTDTERKHAINCTSSDTMVYTTHTDTEGSHR